MTNIPTAIAIPEENVCCFNHCLCCLSS